jgi:LuxR family maltose regulon positive regulatory protein
MAEIIWQPEQSDYRLREHPGGPLETVPAAGTSWEAWLKARRSFTFEGRHGHLTVRKELRARGQGYWYAYRSQQRQTFKRYVGRSADLTLERLKEVAQALERRLRQTASASSGANARATGEQTSLLLLTRLQPPPLPRSLLTRERLLRRLDAAFEHRLTLLCAPAGSGKTTLVRQWLAHLSLLPTGAGRETPSVAWLSLEASENDPQYFWRYLVAACTPWLSADERQDTSSYALCSGHNVYC